MATQSLSDPCKHECRTDAGGIVGCALEVGHVLPHESESGHKWVTAHWGSASKPECARCTELAGHLKVALERIDELERGMP